MVARLTRHTARTGSRRLRVHGAWVLLRAENVQAVSSAWKRSRARLPAAKSKAAATARLVVCRTPRAAPRALIAKWERTKARPAALTAPNVLRVRRIWTQTPRRHATRAALVNTPQAAYLPAPFVVRERPTKIPTPAPYAPTAAQALTLHLEAHHAARVQEDPRIWMAMPGPNVLRATLGNSRLSLPRSAQSVQRVIMTTTTTQPRRAMGTKITPVQQARTLRRVRRRAQIVRRARRISTRIRPRSVKGAGRGTKAQPVRSRARHAPSVASTSTATRRPPVFRASRGGMLGRDWSRAATVPPARPI